MKADFIVARHREDRGPVLVKFVGRSTDAGEGKCPGGSEGCRGTARGATARSSKVGGLIAPTEYVGRADVRSHGGSGGRGGRRRGFAAGEE